MNETPQLNRIHAPEDLRNLTMQELDALSRELRGVIVDAVAENGGHLSSNLGVIDLTIALHRVFHAPQDKVLWDVGHQSYPHKLLTGRRDDFPSIRRFGGLCGFCRPAESEYDAFISGHAGNAISAAMGFSVASDLNGTENHVVAVVGDGALINGISLEALNNLRSTCKRLIVVVNDNEMSIEKSIGAIPRYLNSLITGRNYNRFKAFAKVAIGRLPGGSSVISGIRQLEQSAKNLFVPGIFFEEMGIRYIGPINGHDIPELIRTFERIRDFSRPVLVHVITEKGHGCEYAREDPERFHGTGAFDPGTGRARAASGPTFSHAFGRKLDQLAASDERIVAITAAMAAGCGISHDFIRKYPDRFFDVGIAEEHAVVFAGGLAAAGLRPVVAMYSTFLQRAFDCVLHDICLQNLPVLFCVDRAGIVEDGPTHHGIYDLSFLRTMPHLSILMPESEAVLGPMMDSALRQESPAAIRYPRGGSGAPEDETPPPVEWGRAVLDREGRDLAVWTCGRELYQARKTADILKEKYGISAAVYNARFLKPFDADALRECARSMPVVSLEDHCIRGGLGSIIAEHLIDAPNRGLHCFGWDCESEVPHGSVSELRRAAGLLPEQLADRLASLIRP